MSDIRHLLEDARTSVAFAADAECVCGDGPQRCKYCAPHRAVLDRIDEVLGGADEPARRQLDTVAGLEMHAILHPHHLDTSPDLLPCPFCGHEGAFTDGHKRGVSDNYTVAAACSNTSCGVRTPEHYKDRASAAVAWNRRALNRT